MEKVSKSSEPDNILAAMLRDTSSDASVPLFFLVTLNFKSVIFFQHPNNAQRSHQFITVYDGVTHLINTARSSIYWSVLNSLSKISKQNSLSTDYRLLRKSSSIQFRQ